jgi:hypothetical protein
LVEVRRTATDPAPVIRKPANKPGRNQIQNFFIHILERVEDRKNIEPANQVQAIFLPGITLSPFDSACPTGRQAHASTRSG